MLGEMVLGMLIISVALFNTNQSQQLEARSVTVQTLESLRTDQYFDLFWMKVNEFVSFKTLMSHNFLDSARDLEGLTRGHPERTFMKLQRNTTGSSVLKQLMYTCQLYS